MINLEKLVILQVVHILKHSPTLEVFLTQQHLELLWTIEVFVNIHEAFPNIISHFIYPQRKTSELLLEILQNIE